MKNNLKILDFSKGIRDEEVMFNFKLLYDLISRERLSSAGYGLIEGLHIDYLYPDEERQRFKLHMKDGTFINKKGEEVYKNSQDLFLEYFNTVMITEDLVPDEDGTVRLKEYPYVKNSWELVENNKEANMNNIQIFYSNKESQVLIPPKNIEGKTLTVDSRIKDKLKIIYYMAKPRYDVLTFDIRDVITYHKGIESESSSFFDTYKKELVLAIVKCIPHKYPETKEAVLEITQMRDISMRKIWIDQETGVLYICGIPFDGTQFISIEEPKDPFLYQFWYDSNTNQLKVWRDIRGVEQWVVISDNSYMDSTKNKLWSIENLPQDRQTFLFDPIKERELIYAEGTNSLEILIDNAILMSDQYYELTKKDIKENISIFKDIIPKEQLDEYLKLEEQDQQYFNQGVGFLLKEPLVQDAYVEVRVKHTTRTSIPPKRFERSGVFIDEKRLPTDTIDNIFITDTNFLKDSNQLSVYLNGNKLTNKIDYKEIEIIESSNSSKNYCKSFMLLKDIKRDDILAYRIIGNIMSYDDLNLYMEEVLEHYENAKDDNESIKNSILRLESLIKEERSIRNEEVKKLQEEINKLQKENKTLLKKNEFISSLDNKIVDLEIIDQRLNANQVESMQAVNNYTYELETNKENIYIDIYSKLDTTKQNEIIPLIKDIDFSITNNVILFLNTSLVDNAIGIYINGIAYNMKGVD